MESDDDDHLKAVTEKLKQGLEVKDRRWRLKTYKQVFLGSDAVTFFLKEKYAANESDAVTLGAELMSAGVFQHCLRDHPFKNEPLFYRFVDQDTFHGGYAHTFAAELDRHCNKRMIRRQSSLSSSAREQLSLQSAANRRWQRVKLG